MAKILAKKMETDANGVEEQTGIVIELDHKEAQFIRDVLGFASGGYDSNSLFSELSREGYDIVYDENRICHYPFKIVNGHIMLDKIFYTDKQLSTIKSRIKGVYKYKGEEWNF